MTSPIASEDRAEIAALAAAYAAAVDRREFALLREVFTPDAVLDTGRGRRDGIDAIIAAMQGLRRYDATSHLVGQQHLVAVDDDHIRGITWCEAHHLAREPGGVDRTDTVMHIRYHDEVVRAPAGWRIASRRLEVAWTDVSSVNAPGRR